MINAFHRFQSTSKYAKGFEWVKLLLVTGGAQVFIQGIGFGCGILVIRSLPTSEYALYTLANTMLGTMAILTDGGINTGVLTQGGRVWQDPAKLGIVINTGMNLRRKFAVVTLILVIPLLLFLLINHGASWVWSILIIASLVPAFFTALSGSLLEIGPKLHQDIKPLQKNQVIFNIGRLILLSSSLVVFPFAYISILATGLPQLWANRQLKKISAGYVDFSQKPDVEVKEEILHIVKRILPTSIYYCIHSQISIWLISIFGTTDSIAKIGALSRLTMIFTLINVVFATLVVPRFARLSEQKNLLSLFFKIQIGLLLLSTCIISAVILFDTEVLWVLGENYNSLTIEVVLITISSCISFMGGITYSVSLSRGLVLSPYISIGISILTQIVLFYMLDLSNMKNVLVFSIIDYAIAYLMMLFYFIYMNRFYDNKVLI
jgi:O-antigen/teichoic acid export membrane protein